MRYTLSINAVKCQEWDINLAQGALFDLINQASSWAKPCVVNGNVYYWMSRNKIIEEIPVAYTKADTVYRSLKNLADKGLIEYIKEGKKDLIRMTEKGMTWNVKGTVQGDAKLGNKSELENNTEINPSKSGNKSEKTAQNADINPTYKSTNYKTTKDKSEPVAATKNPEPQILETNQSGFAVTEDLEISEKTKTVRSQKADQVLNWQEPTIATAKEILFLAGKELNLTGTEYRMSVEDFKAYYADQADLGRGLTPRMIQPRFRDWLINDVNKKSRQQPQQTNYQGNNHANHQSANSQYQQPKQSSADQYAAKLAEQRRQRDEAANNSAYGSHHGNVYDMETHF